MEFYYQTNERKLQAVKLTASFQSKELESGGFQSSSSCNLPTIFCCIISSKSCLPLLSENPTLLCRNNAYIRSKNKLRQSIQELTK